MNPENLKFVVAATAGAIVMDIYHTRRNKRLMKQMDTGIDQIVHQQNVAWSRVVLLESILIDREVELTEWESLALAATDI